MHIYEVRLRSDYRDVDLISGALPFGRLWYGEPDDAIEYAKFRSRSHRAVLRTYDEASNVIETHEHTGECKEPSAFCAGRRAPLHPSFIKSSTITRT
jgi:hypothetical protein